jgi:hypothetical protein
MLRRTLIAGCLLVAVLGYAVPATAAPLCSGLDANIPIDFGDGEGSLGDGSICRNFIAGENNAAFYLFDFGSGFDHLLRVTVDTVLQDFGLTFTREFLDPATIFEPFSSFQCVAYGREGQCVEYSADLPPIEGEEFDGDVTWLVAWEQPVGTSPIPEILHERTFNDQNGDDLYDEILEGIFFSATLGPSDFACDSPYTTQCESTEISLTKEGGPGDPARGATSDNFSKIVVAQDVPEPGTLALLGLGLSGLVLGRRNRPGGK